MPEDLANIEGLRSQRHARADWTAGMTPQQLFDFRRDDIVAALPIAEHAKLVLHLLGTIDGDGDADAVLGEKFDDVGPKERGVRGQTEIDLFAQRRSLLARIQI